MIALYIILGLLVVLLIAGLLTPSRYSIARSETIASPPSAIHKYVGHLDRWQDWMPWEQDDPSIITSRGEQTTGVGAKQSWTSKKAGDGEVEFTACDERTGVAYDLTFIAKDKRIPAEASIRYAPVEGGTEVTWTMDGDVAGMIPLMLRGLMKPLMVSMMGKNCARGLASLKDRVEAVA